MFKTVYDQTKNDLIKIHSEKLCKISHHYTVGTRQFIRGIVYLSNKKQLEYFATHT